MRSTKRAVRPVLAVIVVLLGSVAVSLAQAGPASAVAGRTLELDVYGTITGSIPQPPYVVGPCDALAHNFSRTNGSGWAAVEYSRSCGTAVLQIAIVGQVIASTGDIEIRYGATFRHNGRISSRSTTFTMRFNTIRSIARWTVGSGDSRVDVRPYVRYS